jgi:hypothetical protein
MAYKRQSPVPIAESGTNYISQSNVNGTIIFDGTGLSSLPTGVSGWVLTSIGPGSSPEFQPLAGSGSSWIGSAQGRDSQISNWDGISPFWTVSIFSLGAYQQGNSIQPIFPFPFACIISNLYVVVTANNSSNITSSFININGSNTSLGVTIPANTVGTFSDTTHSVTVMAGDLMYLVSNQTGGMTQIVNGAFTIQITP